MREEIERRETQQMHSGWVSILSSNARVHWLTGSPATARARHPPKQAVAIEKNKERNYRHSPIRSSISLLFGALARARASTASLASEYMGEKKSPRTR